jgi:hypothetical protein
MIITILALAERLHVDENRMYYMRAIVATTS